MLGFPAKIRCIRSRLAPVATRKYCVGANFKGSRKKSTMGRGSLIVFEGCDRAGKSTQCVKLVEALEKSGTPAKLWRFPDRGTAIGGIISQYLEKKCELEDHAVHLLFSANRWEAVPKMKEHLLQGTTLIVDRYAFSGVAFTAAKQGFGLDWCRQPDIGLPKPDLILYLTLTPEEAAKRGGFGGERYENTPFQEKVAKNFEHLKENNWRVIDAGKDMESLHEEIQEITRAVIKDSKDKDIEKLWINHDYPVKKRKSLGEINTNQCMGNQLKVK